MLQDKQQVRAEGYDHSYFFAPERDMHTPIAKVWSADENVQLVVSTDKPAMQLYTGNWLAGTPNRLGSHYKEYVGLALETQFYPIPSSSRMAATELHLAPRRSLSLSNVLSVCFNILGIRLSTELVNLLLSHSLLAVGNPLVTSRFFD